MCYFDGDAVHRPGKGQLEISAIDSTLCTHFIYLSAAISKSGGMNILSPKRDMPNKHSGYKKFTELRKSNPNATILISVTGWEDGKNLWISVFRDPLKHESFINNSVKFLKHYEFDGLCIQWEYQWNKEYDGIDVHTYPQFMNMLRSTFDKEGLLLTLSVDLEDSRGTAAFHTTRSLKYVHIIILKAYNYHRSSEKVTGLNAPLYWGSWEREDQKHLNVVSSYHDSITYYIMFIISK